MANWNESVVTYRRELHQIPELGFQEKQTSQFLIDTLHHLGLDPVRIADTGVMVDVVGNRPGPCVAVRADMDGLPLEEDTGLPFCSRHPGVMHACGHDGHMAIALALASRLQDQRDFPGKVRVFFQPAEEKPPGGAPKMIAGGCLEGVDEVLGLHLWAGDPVGTVGIRSGPLMANADQFTIRIQGKGGHGSEPADTKDAILIASMIVMNLQTIVSRRLNAFDTAVVSCGTIRGGATFNIIAETAEITGTVRTLSKTIQDRIIHEIQHIAHATAQLYDAEATVTYQYGYPAVVNHEASVNRIEEAIRSVVDVFHPDPAMGGEDFAYYLQEKSGAFFFLGCRPEGESFPHHSPHFQINENALPLGVDVLFRCAMNFLEGR
ncbi:MAG: amidohydrolase [Firmicutes bacterium]|jgi:amidohydrolase|uniref:Amidohydrolase n=1 Tax=Sulfobacillus benefaciens TaxID=453960 RepID=A0A2T2X804_9FIRM|nr:amidohydrolase [Bacillota bacterium]MCL5014103.1 amidohydrolase [Bacillota bacterium]PSR30578.1 MAG: amidohydrolase [Sulfobacillus benefaciens]